MFWTYLRRELRRRSKQAAVVAVGLAIGIGLVIIVSATSAGVKNAQGQVLHSLYGVGTDATVTKTVTPGTTGHLHFGGFGGSGTAKTRPAAGTRISRNTLRPSPGQATMPATDVAKIAKLPGAAAATGGLVLTDTSFTGTIPSSASGGAGGFGGAGAAGPSASGGGPSFNINSFSVDGVEITKSDIGPLNPAEIVKGRYFSPADNTADVAIVSSAYAKSNKLAIGSTLTVAGTKTKVIGIADVASGSSDAYLPLGTAQKLAGLSGKVTDVFVSAVSASDVSTLASEVTSVVPKATVATSATLAKEVSGSLSSASNLATNLGKWLSIAALVVAFLLAGLLMMAAVSRRVREFGTLKAIGWRTRRVVGQVMGEGLAMGVIGGVAGIALGIAGSEVVSAVSPSLTASIAPAFAAGGGFGGASGSFGGALGASGSAPSRFAGHGAFAHGAAAAAHSVLVHLTAPLQGETIGIAVGLAVAGGLVAGAFGAWRAAHLRPADALRRVE